MSQLRNYYEIDTAAELVAVVRHQNMSTNPSDIDRAVIILGNTPPEELDRLANDTTTPFNDDGHMWGFGTRGTQKAFYQLAFSVWGWEQATLFYNNHTNPEAKEARKLILTDDEKTILEMYLLMTTEYRKKEEAACLELGTEKNDDGTVRYANMLENALWWSKASKTIEGILAKLKGR